MPNYNGERYLEHAINSVLQQSFSNIECIVLDDGSTDESLEIVTRIQKSDSRLKLSALNHGGIVTALNHGLEKGKGTYIARMDSDDEMLPNRLKEQYDYLQKNPDTLLGTNAFLCDPKLKTLGLHNPSEGHDQILRKLLTGLGSAIMHPTLMASKEVFMKIGGYREQYRHVEDLDLYLRAHLSGFKLANLTEVNGLNYRLHPKSISNSKAELQMKLKKQLLEELEKSNNIAPDWEGLERSERMMPRNKSAFYRRWSSIAFSNGNERIGLKYLIKSCVSNPSDFKNLIEGFRLLKYHISN